MSLNFDPLFSQGQTIGRDQKLTYNLAGTYTRLFSSDSRHFLQRHVPEHFRVAQRQHGDIEPRNRSSLRFGDQCVIEFSSEIPADLFGCELNIRLPPLYRTDGGFAALNGGAGSNPADGASYITAGGSATDFLEWQPWVAEKLLGGLLDVLNMRHCQEPLRTVSPHELHFKRLLTTPSIGTTKRTVYANGVGALVDQTNVPNQLVIPLWLPWSPDQSFSLNDHLPAHAIGEPIVIQFKIPNLSELVSTNIPLANISAGTLARPDIFLRNHYIIRQHDERAMTANETLNGSHIDYQTTQTVSERDVEVAASATDVTVDVDVENTKLPCVMTIITAHYKDDLQPVGSLATAPDVDTDDTTKRTFTVGGVPNIIARPNWTTTIPIKSWSCMDGPDRVEAAWTMGHWLNSHHGFVRYFPKVALTSEVAVIPWSEFPTVENDSCGHIDFAVMKKPRIRVTLPPNNAKNQSQTRVVRVVNITRNRIQVKNGAIGALLHTRS